jgi:hypothetical protein
MTVYRESVTASFCWGMARRLWLMALLWLSGCAVQTAGHITTHDGNPVPLYRENIVFQFVPGPAEVEFSPDTVFGSDVVIVSGGQTVKLRVPKEHYQQAAFRLPANTWTSAGHLAGDLEGRWKTVVLGERLERGLQSCDAMGFCPQDKLVQFCDGKGACEKVWVSQWGYGYCPGTQQVERVIQDYKRELLLEFRDPPGAPLVSYFGQSPAGQSVLSSRPLTPCFLE